MGYTAGFTSGVTLTLGVAYLTALTLQRTRAQQSLLLRQQAHTLDTSIQQSSSSQNPPPLTREELAAAARANFVEQAKDKWNAEIEGAVRWVQRTDWGRVREAAEDRLAVVWYRAFGGEEEARRRLDEMRGRVEEARSSAAGSMEEVKSNLGSRVEEAKSNLGNRAEELKGDVSGAARDALEQTLERAALTKKTVVEEVEDARWRIVAAAETGAAKASEAADSVRSVAEQGASKAMEVTEDAKNAVFQTEKKAEEKVNGALAPTSDVEKVLRQRYVKSKGPEKTVEEVLRERYMPLDKRDNAVLRGV